MEATKERIPVNSEKIKVKRARILMIGIPEIEVIKGSLGLRGCTLPKGLRKFIFKKFRNKVL